MTEVRPTAREDTLKRLLAAVESVRETVAAAAAEAEAIKTLPQATVDAVDAAGLLRLKLPAILGGAEADPVTQTTVIEALSYVDASAGWCLMIGASRTRGWQRCFHTDGSPGRPPPLCRRAPRGRKRGDTCYRAAGPL
jgi:alkylation response protein AidB-like acyl-CoA dehydrogenase